MAKKGSIQKKLKVLLLMLLIAAGLGLYIFYRAFYGASVKIPEKSRIVYIHTGWRINKVAAMLEEQHIISSPKEFKLLARIKKYASHIKPGRYRVLNNMSNMQLIDLLKSGRQDPETVSIHNIRTLPQLAGLLAYKLESDSVAVIHALVSKKILKQYGFTAQTVMAMFIPGTYKVLWTDTPPQFMAQMYAAYKEYWNSERQKLAAAIPLSPVQVSTLASIVQAEQAVYDDEKPVIAGLYINRLKKNIPLQSDPTLLFARGDFSIMRVRAKDKEINSPYNTYKHTGLPPGPIDLPELSSLDAVLHYQKSDYLYMCAKADFSGRHHFSTSFKEQEKYAASYQRALNKRGIMR